MYPDPVIFARRTPYQRIVVTAGRGSFQLFLDGNLQFASVDEYLAAMRGRIPLGRVGLPDDTARAVAFLCSSESIYVTGEAMNVSGGEEMH